jgi:ABC-type xylose transport system permease subunit
LCSSLRGRISNLRNCEYLEVPSLFGGQGGIGNTIIGLFVLGILNNGLDHVRIDSFLKILIRGLILLIALIINVYAQRLRASRSPVL